MSNIVLCTLFHGKLLLKLILVDVVPTKHFGWNDEIVVKLSKPFLIQQNIWFGLNQQKLVQVFSV